MVLGITLAIAAMVGIIEGIVKKRKALVIASVILLMIIAAVMIYFHMNPY